MNFRMEQKSNKYIKGERYSREREWMQKHKDAKQFHSSVIPLKTGNRRRKSYIGKVGWGPVCSDKNKTTECNITIQTVNLVIGY